MLSDIFSIVKFEFDALKLSVKYWGTLLTLIAITIILAKLDYLPSIGPSIIENTPALNHTISTFNFYGIGLLVILLSFDMLTSDLEHRTASFPLLRINRATWYLGKIIAYTLFTYFIVLIDYIAIFICDLIFLEDFSIIATIKHSCYSLVLILPLLFCWTSIVALCSGKKIGNTLFTAILVLIALAMLFIFGEFVSDKGCNDISCQILIALSYITPFKYVDLTFFPSKENNIEFWRYCAAIISFIAQGSIWSAIGIISLHKRDL